MAATQKPSNPPQQAPLATVVRPPQRSVNMELPAPPRTSEFNMVEARMRMDETHTAMVNIANQLSAAQQQIHAYVRFVGNFPRWLEFCERQEAFSLEQRRRVDEMKKELDLHIEFEANKKLLAALDDLAKHLSC